MQTFGAYSMDKYVQLMFVLYVFVGTPIRLLYGTFSFKLVEKSKCKCKYIHIHLMLRDWIHRLLIFNIRIYICTENMNAIYIHIMYCSDAQTYDSIMQHSITNQWTTRRRSIDDTSRLLNYCSHTLHVSWAYSIYITHFRRWFLRISRAYSYTCFTLYSVWCIAHKLRLFCMMNARYKCDTHGIPNGYNVCRCSYNILRCKLDLWPTSDKPIENVIHDGHNKGFAAR